MKTYKKKLSDKQVIKLKSFIDLYPTKVEGQLAFANKAQVSLSSVQKSLINELSDVIIDKIIKAL